VGGKSRRYDCALLKFVVVYWPTGSCLGGSFSGSNIHNLHNRWRLVCYFWRRCCCACVECRNVCAGYVFHSLIWRSVLSSESVASAFRSWTDHTLPVKQVIVGAGGAAARVFTASLDHTVKICEIGAGLLHSILFPSAVHCSMRRCGY